MVDSNLSDLLTHKPKNSTSGCKKLRYKLNLKIGLYLYPRFSCFKNVIIIIKPTL